MKLNREKVCAAITFALFLFGAYSLIGTQERHPEININLAPGNPDVLPLDHLSYGEDLGGGRNPFRLSSEWKPVVPEPLDLPPVQSEKPARVTFGWSSELIPGAPIHYRKSPLVEVKEKAVKEDGFRTGKSAIKTSFKGGKP